MNDPTRSRLKFLEVHGSSSWKYFHLKDTIGPVLTPPKERVRSLTWSIRRDTVGVGSTISSTSYILIMASEEMLEVFRDNLRKMSDNRLRVMLVMSRKMGIPEYTDAVTQEFIRRGISIC